MSRVTHHVRWAGVRPYGLPDQVVPPVAEGKLKPPTHVDVLAVAGER